MIATHDASNRFNTVVVTDHAEIEELPVREPVRMRADRCRKVIGADISDDKMAECFTRLGFSFKKEGRTFVVDAPSYRFDIEIEEDLIEEVARLLYPSERSAARQAYRGQKYESDDRIAERSDRRYRSVFRRDQ